MRVQSTVVVMLVVSTVVLAPAAGCDSEVSSFLWRVSSGERSVFLLGSIHFMKEDAYPLGAAIERAFDNAGMVVFETDIDELGDAAVSLLVAGTLEGDATLADVLPPELFDDVSERLEALGSGVGGFSKMKPWMVALSLTSLELMRADYLSSQGIDAYLSSKAKTEGKPQDGLETIDYQVSLFAEMSEEESVDFLRYTLTELDTMIPLVDELVAAWKIGNSAKIAELLVDGFEGHDALYDRLVTERNLQWLPLIEKLFQGDVDAMVVVGSLHLVGEQGLIELLKGKGYEVEQL